jgi:alpha-D-ribose 1-methylphosphonate 5-triphosphate diphosphatase PhnM
MKTILIKNALLINEGEQFHADVFIKGAFIEKIEKQGINMPADQVIDASGKILIPGLIDDQVHFREPGLTHKGDLYTEPKAAVAGGVWDHAGRGAFACADCCGVCGALGWWRVSAAANWDAHVVGGVWLGGQQWADCR